MEILFKKTGVELYKKMKSGMSLRGGSESRRSNLKNVKELGRLLRRFASRNDAKQNISIICFPFSVGGPNDAASDGPETLLKNSIDNDLKELGYKVKIVQPPIQLIHETSKSVRSKDVINCVSTKKIKNIDLIIKLNKWLASAVSREVKEGSIPLTIGGDHSLAIGTISGVSDAVNNIGVLWIDRHFDAHSPKNTPSWRAHGMPVAVVTANRGYDSHSGFQKLLDIGKNSKLPKVKPENFVQIAIGEKSHINPNTKWYSMEDIDNSGIKKIVNDALNYLLKRVKYVYVAWDIDSLNVTGTGTSGDCQLTLREGLVIAREINKKIRVPGKLIGFEMVEIAPKLERKDLKGQTADWAIQLITTSFGGNLFNNLSRLKRNIHI